MKPKPMFLVCVCVLFLVNPNHYVVNSQSAIFELVNTYDFIERAHYLAIKDSYAFVYEDLVGLSILNISDITNINVVSQLNFTVWAIQDICFQGPYAYLLDTGNTLRIINIANVSTPVTINTFTYDSTGLCRDLYIDESYAYIADNARGMVVIDINDPRNPTEVNHFFTGGAVRDIAKYGDYLLVADHGKGLYVINGSDPTNLDELDFYEMYDQGLFDISLKDDLAYVIGSSSLIVFNITDPSQLTMEGTYQNQNIIFKDDALLNNTFLYVLQHDMGVTVLDVRFPEYPYIIDSYQDTTLETSLACKDSYLFVTGDYTAPKLDILRVTITPASQPPVPSQTTSSRGLTYTLSNFSTSTSSFHLPSISIPNIVKNYFFWLLLGEILVLVALLYRIGKATKKLENQKKSYETKKTN